MRDGCQKAIIPSVHGGVAVHHLNAAPEEVDSQPRAEDDNEALDQPLIETLRPAGSNVGADNCAYQRRQSLWPTYDIGNDERNDR